MSNDTLIIPVENKTKTYGFGGVAKTLDAIVKTVNENSHTVKELAESLKGANLLSTARNIWNYIKEHTTYKLDTPGKEEIRTPGRLLSDGFGDCDDYSIFSASILKSLGYKPFFYVVAFHGKPNFGHIYVGIEDIVIDGVMDKFNAHPDYITKFKKVQLNRTERTFKGSPMEIQLLSGVEPAPDMKHKDTFLPLLKADATGMLGIVWDDVVGFDKNLNPYFDNPEMAQLADEYAERYDNLNGLGDIDGLGQLGSWLSRTWKKVKKGTKKAWNKVKHVAKKAGKLIMKVSMAPARAAFLLLLKLNFLHFAERIYLANLNDKALMKAGLNSSDIKKVRAFWNKMANFWKKAGGNPDALVRASRGRGAKKARKKYGVSGLGSATAAGAAAASATPIIVFFTKIWKAVKTVFGKLGKGVKNLYTKHGKKVGGFLKRNLLNRKEGYDNDEQKADELVDDARTTDQTIINGRKHKSINKGKDNKAMLIGVGLLIGFMVLAKK